MICKNRKGDSTVQEAAWREGVVKFFRYDWGFITLSDTHEDVFVRYTAIRGRGQHGHKSLQPDQKVLLQVETDAKGLRARRVICDVPVAEDATTNSATDGAEEPLQPKYL